MKCENCGANNKSKATFCGVCGQRLIKKNQNNDKYKYLIILSLIILVIAIIIIGITSLNQKKVFFSDELQNEDSIQIVSEESSTFVKKENKSNSSNSLSYSTSIIYDNEYVGNVSSVEEVKKQIIVDSVSQKKNTTSEEIQKIENRIISNYGISAVNFGEMDVETALGIEEVIKYIYQKYPKARTYLSNISLGNIAGIKNAGTIAFFGPQSFITPSDYSGYPEGNKTLVCLSSKFFLNKNLLSKRIEDSCRSGHFPQNASTYSSVVHELGHYLTFVLTMKKYGIDNYFYIDESNIKNEQLFLKDWCNGDLALDIIKEAYKNYQANYNDTTLSFDDFRATISGYAVTKNNNGDYIYHETIAEAFNDYYCNKENAAKASIEIMKVFNQRMEEL